MSTVKQILISKLAEYEHQRATEKAFRDREYRKIKATYDRVMTHIKPATLEEYKEWFETRVINFGLSKNLEFVNGLDRIFVAQDSFWLPPLHGALAIYLIVPKGVIITTKNVLGHSCLLFANGQIYSDMDGYHTRLLVPRELIDIL